MKVSATNIVKLSISACFAFAAFLYFCFLYPYHLNFHESLQMFMYTSGYAKDVISVPGGVADYLSRFLVQFFYYPTLGAANVAILLTAVQISSSRLLLNRNVTAYPLSLLPAIVLWWTLCDENGMVTTIVAVLLSQIAALALISIGKSSIRAAATCISVPVMYMLCGSISVLTPALVLIFEYTRKEKPIFKAIFTIALVIISVICISVAHMIFAYGMKYLLRGLQYYRFINLTPTMAWIATGIAAVSPVLSLLLPKNMRKTSRQYLVTAVMTAVVAIVCYAGVDKCSDYAKEDVFAYEYLANNRQWQLIIDKADNIKPDNPYTVACLNLALAMTGQLPERMFSYFQNGDEGLFPPFVIDFTTPLPTSEVLYNLGLVNAAQRYVFEAQEAIPDFQKSSRCYKRLAEICIINGEYDVADKYLKALDKTLFYKDWAQQTRALLADELSINNHWEYGAIRKAKTTTDAFMGDDVSEGLYYLLNDNQSNKLAFDYLMALCLLNGQLKDFYEYLSSCTFPANYVLPKSYQEALALMWVMDNPSWDGMPWDIRADIKGRMESYLRDMKRNMPADYMRSRYGDTYWQYFNSVKSEK